MTTRHRVPRRPSRVPPVRRPLAAAATLPLLLALALATLTTLAATRPARAGISGGGVTVLHASNLDPLQDAAMVLELIPQVGERPVVFSRSRVAPGAAARFALGPQNDMPGGAWAGRLTSDRDVALLSEQAWPTSGGRAFEGRARAATELVLPRVSLRGGAVAASSILTIQNTETEAAAEATLTLYRNGRLAPELETAYTIGAGRSLTLDLARESAFLGLPPDLLGWMRVHSDTPLAATSFLDVPESALAVSSFPALPAAAADTALLAPLLLSPGSATSLASSLSVLNLSEQHLQARLAVEGLAGGCAGSDVVLDPGLLEPRSVTTIPFTLEDCVAAGRLFAPGPLLGLVQLHEPFDDETVDPPARAAAYVMPPQREAATRLALPALRTSSPTTSALQVLSRGEAEANVQLELFDRDGLPVPCATACRLTLPPLGGARFALDALPEGFRGSAILVSDQPIAAAFLDAPPPPDWDLAAYTAMPATASPPGQTLAFAPLAMSDNVAPGATPPSPTPTSTATPSPAPTSTGPTPLAPTSSATPTATPSPTPTLPPTPGTAPIYLPLAGRS